MTRISGASAVAVLILVPALLFSAMTSAAPPQQDKWTVMVYIDADNNLEYFGVENLQWLESVGSSDEVNFVVLIDTYTDEAYLKYVEQGGSTIVQSWGEVDMASPDTMSKFIKEAKKAYPAKSYAFISWDHGGGWRGLNWDDTTYEQTNGGDDFMNMKELRQAVVDAGLVFDVFAFDQCLMAQPEVAYQVRDYAKYLVFSEETVYGQGFPYDLIAEDMVSKPTMTALECANVMAEDFAWFYNSITWANDWTISVFDMSYMDDMTTAITDLAAASMDSLSMYKTAMKNARSNAQTFYYPYFIDLKGYAMNLVADGSIPAGELKIAAADVVQIIDNGIVSCLNSKHNNDAYGMTIYLPGYKGSYLGYKTAYENVPFALDTDWISFVQAFASNK